MRTSLPSPLLWSRQNQQWKTVLGVPEEVGVRVYSSFPLALFEALVGTALFFNHKRTVGLVHGQCWSSLEQAPFFYKEGYKVITCGLTQAQDWKTWVEQLPADTVAVMWALDHPVTGALLPQADELDRLLNERKIYSVCATHSMKTSGAAIRPYTVRVYDLWDGFSWIEHGLRFRPPSLIAQHVKSVVLPSVSLVEVKYTEDLAGVTEFEGGFDAEAVRLLSGLERLADRAVFAHPRIHGGRIIEELKKTVGIDLLPPELLGLGDGDYRQPLMTTNVSVTGRFNNYRQWWENCPHDDLIRGLVVIDHRLVKLPHFAQAFHDAVQKAVGG